MKKITALLLALSMSLSMSACADKQKNISETDNTINSSSNTVETYLVHVKTQGNRPLSDIDVTVYGDKELTQIKATAVTNENGVAALLLASGTEYYVTISGAPNGYAVDNSYTFDDCSANIILKAQLTEVDDLSEQRKLGDVICDFSFTSSEGEAIILSEVLKEKKLVILDFCYEPGVGNDEEIANMTSLYEKNKDDIEILVFGVFNSEWLKENYEIPYTIISEYPDLLTHYLSVNGYPTSVFVDRYGVICAKEVGVSSLERITELVEHFIADDYKQELFK